MSQSLTIRNAIIATLEAVADIGKVHGFERYAKQASTLKALYVDPSDKRIRGFNVRRANFTKKREADAIYKINTQWQVTGYLSLDDADASELLFDALIDDVNFALSNDPSFGGVCDVPEDYAMKVTQQPVMFCGVLCHQAIFTFTSEHEELAVIADDELNEFDIHHQQIDTPAHETSAVHDQWQQEPADHSNAKPDIDQTIQVKESDNESGND